MPNTTMPAADPCADPMAAALAARMERFERRRTDGTLDMAAVLHDARTPLTVIAASARMAQREAPPEVAAHLERVLRSARLLEDVLVRGLEFLRANPEGAGGCCLGALALAAAALPPGTQVTLRADSVRGADGALFAIRAVVDGAPDAEVTAAARRAVLRHGGSLWREAGPDGGTRYVAEVPCPRAP